MGNKTEFLDLEAYDIDLRTGFMSPDPPMLKRGDKWQIWDLALASASESAVSLHGKDDRQGVHWRTAVQEMPVLPLPNGIEAARYSHMVLSYIAHFYIHSQPIEANFEPERIDIPASIAIPLVQSSNVLGLPPILTYADTVLFNWMYRLDNTSRSPRSVQHPEVSSRDIECPVQFTRSASENHFYVTTAVIELRGATALQSIAEALNIISSNITLSDRELRKLCEILMNISKTVRQVKEVLSDIKTDCDPEVFFNEIRPWYNGTATSSKDPKIQIGWHYEGVDESDQVRSYGGPSAGQSSLIHALDAFLGVDHSPGNADHDSSTPAEEVQSTNNKEDTFMRQMMNFMPERHRNFIQRLLNYPRPIRKIVLDSQDKQLQSAFNETVTAMNEFRSEHIRVVTRYIVQPSNRAKTRNPPSVDDTRSKSPDSPRLKSSRNVNGFDSKSSSEKDFESAEGLKGTGGTNLVKFLKLARERTQLAHV